MAKFLSISFAFFVLFSNQTAMATDNDSCIRLSWNKAKFSGNGQYVNFVLKNGVPKVFLDGIVCVKAGKETLKYSDFQITKSQEVQVDLNRLLSDYLFTQGKVGLSGKDLKKFAGKKLKNWRLVRRNPAVEKNLSKNESVFR